MQAREAASGRRRRILVYAGGLTVLGAAIAALAYLSGHYGSGARTPAGPRSCSSSCTGSRTRCRRRGRWIAAGIFAFASVIAWAAFVGVALAAGSAGSTALGVLVRQLLRSPACRSSCSSSRRRSTTCAASASRSSRSSRPSSAGSSSSTSLSSGGNWTRVVTLLRRPRVPHRRRVGGLAAVRVLAPPRRGRAHRRQPPRLVALGRHRLGAHLGRVARLRRHRVRDRSARAGRSSRRIGFLAAASRYFAAEWSHNTVVALDDRR